jgi:hypothetical protein
MQNKEFTEDIYIYKDFCTETTVSLVAGLILYQEHNPQHPGIEGSDVLLIQLVPVLWR